ncbi:MAG: hypothetical protein KME60_02510 [Cyanomargarita calcarea GSE-NOS-MK-12-04C]|jgi:hypothetical protein|uniref:Uncharacterized protein n=1 Tax=Cyanomargarita calcarea GSE-NOS-MK-12-04C TaxID=2839659 RepID=A0A951UQU1_9CYAN|nr:hypothetical protein [Cyanomargarita calcarea GSE-NOS-MK-12-04C]
MERIIRSNAVETSSQLGVCGIFIYGCAVVVSAGVLPKKHKGTKIAASTIPQSIIRNICSYRSTSLQIVLDQYYEEWSRLKATEGTEGINKNKISRSPTLPIPMSSETSQTSLFRQVVTKTQTLLQSGVAKRKVQFWYVLINEIVSFFNVSVLDGMIQPQQGIGEIATQYMSSVLVANIPHPKVGFFQKKIPSKIKFDYPYPDYNIITTKVISRYLDTESNEDNNQFFEVEAALKKMDVEVRSKKEFVGDLNPFALKLEDFFLLPSSFFLLPSLKSKSLTNVRNKNPTIKLKVGHTFTAKIVKNHRIFDMFLNPAK